MGWLLRTKNGHFGIEYRAMEKPANPDAEVYEIVEADGLIKPAEQIAAEAVALAAAKSSGLAESDTGKTIADLNERINSLIEQNHALIDALKTGDPGQMKTVALTIEKMQPRSKEEALAAVAEKLSEGSK